MTETSPAPSPAAGSDPVTARARTGKPPVLFVCIHDAGRSRMAAGWLTALAGDAIKDRT